MIKPAARYAGLDIFLKLSPFLVLYAVIALAGAPETPFGDEPRYLAFAHNLLHGFYSPPPPGINLWNGPGYPALLAVLMFLKLPVTAMRLANAVLLFGSLVIHYRTARLLTTPKTAWRSAVLLGLYFPVFQRLPYLLTEVSAWFLVSLACHVLVRAYSRPTSSARHHAVAALVVACLVMTKVIFGYVVLVMGALGLAALAVPAWRAHARTTAAVFGLAFVLCTPWLAYTYHLTGKVLYWTNSGGLSLYTMSTPFAGELGDFNTLDELRANPRHAAFVDSVTRLPPVASDEAFRAAAVDNIRRHPEKYLGNWVANTGRLLFSYPYSHTDQTIKSYFTILPNTVVCFFVAIALAACLRYPRRMPPALAWLTLFLLVYLFGSSLVSAYRRMFYITMPFWFLLIAYAFTHRVSLRFRKDPDGDAGP